MVPSKWMASKTLQLILAALIGAAVLAGVSKVLQWREGAAQNESRQRNDRATQGILGDGSGSSEARAEADFSNASGRQTFNETLDKENRNDPEAAARAARPVSDARLRAFRERRAARERAAADRLRRAGIER